MQVLLTQLCSPSIAFAGPNTQHLCHSLWDIWCVTCSTCLDDNFDCCTICSGYNSLVSPELWLC